MNAVTRILIADDHPLFRDALRIVVDRLFPRAEVVEACGYLECLTITRAGDPFDLVFVDLMMPGGSESLDTLRRLRAQIPSTPTVVVSSREDWPIIRRVMALGAAAYIPKSTPKSELEKAIRCVLAGDVWVPDDTPREVRDAQPEATGSEPLTPRQAAVLEQLARGSSNRQIAADLNIEEITVKAHISAILRKLHVKNRLEAVVATRAFAGRGEERGD
jgi:DNA-binding NarL/FixJ family response regulator